MHDFIIHMLLAPFFHIGEKTKMYFLKDNSNMLSEKKFSKKSPSKIDISSVLEQIGLLSRGKVSICSQGEALGGIAERPLTAIFPYNGLRGRDACRWRFLLINAGGSPLKPWALPTPSRTFSPAPVLPGALPPDPHNSPL